MYTTILLAALTVAAAGPTSGLEPGDLPKGDEVKVDTERGEIRFNAQVQHPHGKPCIDTFGQRIQAFVGCSRAGGQPAEFADFFVFLAGADTDSVYQGLGELGLQTDTHYSRAEGRKRAGKEFLKGDPVSLSIAWRERDRWVERPYQEMVTEQVVVEGKEVVRPWKPRFVFHGSGSLHKSGTGCVACPCDCPGGLIADVTYPIYEPKPTVKFDWTKAPPEGSTVVVRIRRTGPGH